MMYKIINVLSNVVKMFPLNGSLIHSTINGELFSDTTKIDSNIDSASLWKVEDFVYYHGLDGSHRFYRRNVIVSKYGIFKSNQYTKSLLGFENVKRISKGLYTRDIIIVDGNEFSSRKIVAESIPGEIDRLSEDLFYSLCEGGNLSIYSLSLGKKKWECRISEIVPELLNSYFKKNIGVFENQLIVGLNNNQILILNSENGEVIRLLHESPEYYYVQKRLTTLPPSQYFEFDKTNNTLISLYGNCFFEIDLKNNYSITVTDLKESLTQNGLITFRRSTGYAFDSEYIYTVGELDKENNGSALGDRSVLAFNRATKKIEWNYPFENSSINTDVPKLDSEGKLYILDSKNTLHIFQKT